MGEVKDILRSWILGMGPLDMLKPKSICIAGPPGSGKRFLAKAIATDMSKNQNVFSIDFILNIMVSFPDAIMFNLSASVVSKFSDDMNTFMENVFKMAKLMSPSVLYIDGAHTPFIKKANKYH